MPDSLLNDLSMFVREHIWKTEIDIFYNVECIATVTFCGCMSYNAINSKDVFLHKYLIQLI